MKNERSCCRPVDHDDTFTKLDHVSEREGEPPGQLLDAADRLDSWLSPAAAAAAALLLPPERHKQLGEKHVSTSAE